MKFIITICSCICFLATSNIAWAQQDAQYTQFMFNKLYFMYKIKDFISREINY